MEKFVFYDLETTGISTAFDQPLQFICTPTQMRFSKGETTMVSNRC